MKKYFKMWLKITILLYQIFILERKCNKYPDLRIYLGNPEAKEIVKYWRLMKDVKEKELKELVK